MRACIVEDCPNEHRARGLCSTHYNQHDPDRHRRVRVRCVVCGRWIRRARKADRRPTCRPECRARLQDGVYHAERDWAEDAQRRARDAGATVIELIYRIDVFERDAWVCHLCGRPTEPMASIYDPASPTVDHVVSLSTGGQHTMSNVRCAHLLCNSVKGRG